VADDPPFDEDALRNDRRKAPMGSKTAAGSYADIPYSPIAALITGRERAMLDAIVQRTGKDETEIVGAAIRAYLDAHVSHPSHAATTCSRHSTSESAERAALAKRDARRC
jgi:hypothetical protein